MSKVIYIIAPGPTLNEVTDEEWDYLSTQTTLGISCTPFTNKKFSYYFTFENEISTNIFLDVMAENKYLDTHLLLGRSIINSIIYAQKLGFKKITPIIKGRGISFGKPWMKGESSPGCKFKDVRAKAFNQGLFRYRGSLSAAINCALLLGADEIRLVGVELNNMHHFIDFNTDKWNINEKDKERLKKYTNIYRDNFKYKFKKQPERMKNFNLETMHTTSMDYPYGNGYLIGMHKVINWMDSELRNEGMTGIFITNKKSILYTSNEIEYKTIMEK